MLVKLFDLYFVLELKCLVGYNYTNYLFSVNLRNSINYECKRNEV